MAVARHWLHGPAALIRIGPECWRRPKAGPASTPRPLCRVPAYPDKRWTTLCGQEDCAGVKLLIRQGNSWAAALGGSPAHATPTLASAHGNDGRRICGRSSARKQVEPDADAGRGDLDADLQPVQSASVDRQAARFAPEPGGPVPWPGFGPYGTVESEFVEFHKAVYLYSRNPQFTPPWKKSSLASAGTTRN